MGVKHFPSPPSPIPPRKHKIRTYARGIANAVAQKFLLQKDTDALIAAAEGSGVLK